MNTNQVMNMTPEARKQLAIRQKMKGMTPADIVKAWYVAEESFDLTEEEDTMRQRWDFCKAQFLARKNYSETVEAIQTEFGCSIATARNDVRHMRYIFGDLDEVPKQAHRQRAIQMALEAFEVAKTEKDGKGMAAATKIYVEAAGLDRDDADKIDIEKMMKDRVYVEALDPMARTFLLNFLKNGGGSADASELFERIYAAGSGEFVEYEDAPDEQPAAADDNQ